MTINEMNQRRQELGYSYAKLSQLSGVPIPTIQKVLSGTTKSPRYDTIQALGAVLKKDPNDYAAVAMETVGNQICDGAPDYTVKYPYDRQGSYTIADRNTIPDEYRTELIDGVIYDMSSPVFFHQQAAGAVYYQITNFIHEKGGDCIPMIAPMDVRLDCDERTMVQPDVFIVCDPDQITEKYINGAPSFVLEVISPSSRRKDYIKKAAKYEHAGVREYWIVDPYMKHIFVYFFEDDNKCPVVCPIDARIPVNIYGGELEIDFNDILRWLPKETEES